MHLNDLLKSRRNDILQIAAKHGAHNVRVFGSVARGEAGLSKSDIDLLVEFKRGTTLLGHAALIQNRRRAHYGHRAWQQSEGYRYVLISRGR